MDRLITLIWARLPVTRKMRAWLMWLLNAKFSVGVVGLVVGEGGTVLLLKHTYRGKRAWGLPGGSLKPGEGLEECLRREVREETGMEVEVGGLLHVVAHRDRKLVDMIYTCRPCPGETLARFRPNAEISEAHYFHPHDFPEQTTSQSQARLIREALSGKWNVTSDE